MDRHASKGCAAMCCSAVALCRMVLPSLQNGVEELLFAHDLCILLLYCCILLLSPTHFQHMNCSCYQV